MASAHVRAWDIPQMTLRWHRAKLAAVASGQMGGAMRHRSIRVVAIAILLSLLATPASMTISNVYTKAIDASFADGLKAGSDYVSLVRICFKSSALRNSAAV